jgi:DNA-binding XRE family transcriptional regulator/tetratricopeptide (TPR) repeat protein
MDEVEVHPLQRARRRLGITQKTLADFTLLSEPTIKRAEQGKLLDDYTITAICEFFSQKYGRPVEREELGLRARWEKGHSNPKELAAPQEDRLAQESGRLPEADRLSSLPLDKAQQTSSEQNDLQETLTQAVTQGIIRGAKELVNHDQRRFTQAVTQVLLGAAKELGSLDLNELRRKILAIPLEIAVGKTAIEQIPFLGIQMHGISAFTAEEFLPQCEAGIKACWKLQKSTEHSDLLLAFYAASAYLSGLQRIVKDSSQHRQKAAGLVTQSLLLKTILAHHVENRANAAYYAQQALFFSEVAQDISLQLRAFECLAVVYTFGRQYQQATQTIGQAIPLLKQKEVPLSPSLQAQIYGMAACALTRIGQDGSAYLDQASLLLPEKDTECPIYVGYGKKDLCLDAGIVHAHQGNSAKAIETLSQFVDPKTFALQVPGSEMRRIEIINAMTMACLKAKNKPMEQVIHFWTAGIEAARALQSERRFEEALTAYEIMETLWPDEKRIIELRDLTQHW